MGVRVGVFGWGIVAPKSPNIEAFKRNLDSTESWLEPFNGFGPDNFLVGIPEFDFAEYQPWIKERFAPRFFQKLKEKMDLPALYAIGAFIQSLAQNPGVEQELQNLGDEAHVYVGTGIGAIDTTYKAAIEHYKSQQQWNQFWSCPDRNSALRAHLDGTTPVEGAPIPDSEEYAEFWAARSPELREYLNELAEIDGLTVEGDVENAKLHAIREKEKRHGRLQEKWGAPLPPWSVSPNIIWNIHNTPAAQISILGRIHGMAFSPVAACSTFGVALHLAMRAIRCGEAKLVVVGATDPPPHPLTVGSFYTARVLSANRAPSVPLTKLQGTHVAGGAVVWIVGDMEYMRSKGFKPLGMEPIAAGVSSDADHIITPSLEGPVKAIEQALQEANADPAEVTGWDLHATATPGDYSEVQTLRSVVPESVLVTARKGTFGHGMSAGGGWELTAQYLGYEQGRLFPTPLPADALNKNIRAVHGNFVFDKQCPAPAGLAGKLSMGIGGINACVVSRALEPDTKQ